MFAEHDDGRCWMNRWHPTLPRCANAGTHGNPNGRTSFDRACRWCREHAQPGDIRIEPAISPRSAQEEGMAKKGEATSVCHWDRADDDTDMWETSCGHAFCFNDDGPVENGFAFCGYCGGRLQAQKVAVSSRMRPASVPDDPGGSPLASAQEEG